MKWEGCVSERSVPTKIEEETNKKEPYCNFPEERP